MADDYETPDQERAAAKRKAAAAAANGEPVEQRDEEPKGRRTRKADET